MQSGLNANNQVGGEMKFKVQYTVQGNENVFSTETYDTYELAVSHKDDIAGYEGVENVTLVPVEEV